MNKRLVSAVAIPSAAVLLSAGVILYADARWKSRTRQFRERMMASRRSSGIDRFDPPGIEALPAPVKRYLNAVLTPGQPVITAARFSQKGTFRLRDDEKSWVRFEATQAVTTTPPSFDWRARMALAPGLSVLVQDSYFQGVGTLRGAIHGLVPVMQASGTPQMNRGELIRFLAEAPWYPTVLLPGHGIRWEPMTDSSARAVRTDHELNVAAEVHFDDSGLVSRVYVPSRFRMNAGGEDEAPWQGRFRAYREMDGVRVPTEGEVAWLLPDGPQPYWRATVTDYRRHGIGDTDTGAADAH